MAKNNINIKRVSMLMLGALLAVIGATFTPWQQDKATAAGCTVPSPNYGTVTSTVAVSTAGTYTLWSRIMAPDATKNSYLLEVDGANCYTVGDASSIPANAWTWVDYQSGNTATKITLNLSAGSHTIKMIGREATVKVDRLLAVGDAKCVPTGLGDNCAAAVDAQIPQVSLATSINNTSATVAITATATDNIGVAKVDFYVDGALKSTDAASPYSYTWSTQGVTNGSHNITVKAYDAAGNVGSASSTVTINTGDTQAPTTPGSVTASPDNGKVTLKWSASTDNTGVTAYRVIRDGVQIGTSTTTQYTDTKVSENTTYSYQVSAVDAANNVSNASPAVKITTPRVADTQAPATPKNFTGTAVSPTQINLRWSASSDNVSVQSYSVYRYPFTGSSEKLLTTTATEVGDTGLKPNTSYTYHITARDGAGNVSAKSQTITVKTPTQAVSTGTVQGKVTGNWWRDINGAQVTITVNGKRYTATTNKSGVYRLSGVPAGKYTMTVSAKGYKTTYVSVTIKANTTVTRHVRLGGWWWWR